MAKNNVAKGRAGDKSVNKEIKRAAARMAYAPSVEDPEAEATLDRSDEELDVLRALVRQAEQTFEYDGPMTKDPRNVLTEALQSAADDFALFGDEVWVGGGTATNMMFRRAQLRCQLAVALFAYRQSFGFPEPIGKVVEEEGEVVS
jgi:hypothetical protein